jgi:hypothetical protein
MVPKNLRDVPKRERILAFDLMRGYFLSVILIDHFAMYPNIFDFASGRGQLWASAAEGFFLISGMLVGYVYTPRMLKSPKLAIRKLLERALKLYFWAVALTWFMTFAGNKLLGHNIKEGLWIAPRISEYLYKTLTLQYSYGWNDFLQYYVVFLISAPLALWLCTKKKAWLVVIASFAVWLFRGQSFVLAWQLLFNLGIVAGYYLPELERYAREMPARLRRQIFLGFSIFTVVTIFLSALIVIVSTYFVREFHNFAQLPTFLQSLFLRLDAFQMASEPWVYKWTLEPGRLAISLIWFATGYMWFRKYEQRINNVTRGYLKTLGEVSLYVYGVHGILVFFVLVLLPGWYGYLLSSIITALGLAVLYVCARYRLAPKQLFYRLFPRFKPTSV